MSVKYELLPTEPGPSPSTSRPNSPTYPPPEYDSNEYNGFSNDLEEEAPMRRPRTRPVIPAFDSDPRFRVRTPSPYARGALLFLVAFLFWLAFSMRKAVWIAGGMGMSKAPAQEVDPSY